MSYIGSISDKLAYSCNCLLSIQLQLVRLKVKEVSMTNPNRTDKRLTERSPIALRQRNSILCLIVPTAQDVKCQSRGDRWSLNLSSVASLFICLAGAANATAQSLMPMPSPPTSQLCQSMRSHNSEVTQRAIDAWIQNMFMHDAKQRECFSLSLNDNRYAACYDKLEQMGVRTRELRMRSDQLSRQANALSNQCFSAPSAYTDTQRRESARKNQPESSQDSFTALSEKYVAAKDAYAELSKAARVFANPREEIPMIIGEKIQELAGSLAEKKLASDASASSEFYSAAHDRSRDVTIGSVPRNGGVGAIQDSASSELKRRNLAVVAELDKLDMQLKNVASPNQIDKPTLSPILSQRGTLIANTNVDSSNLEYAETAGLKSNDQVVFQDSRTGSVYTIPETHTLYRGKLDPSLQVIPISRAPLTGDDPLRRICSSDGVGRVSVECELERQGRAVRK